MRSFRLISLLPCLLLVLAAPVQAAGGLPDFAREYIAGNYFNGTDPSDPALDAAVTILTIPEAMRSSICNVEWEAGQLRRFAKNKLYLLVDCPDGSTHALMFRDGKKRNDRTLDESRVRVLKRLYSEELWNMPADPVLQEWLDRTEIDSQAIWQRALKACEPQWDRETIERAAANYGAEGTATDELARALGALLDSRYAGQSAWAAVWLISRMDAMSFRREDSSLSVPDLQAVTARQFYENVRYAVIARNEFPWARKVSDKDFLQQVLSPRGSGEPLQRWRRQFYLALLPELEGLGAQDVQQAIEIAGNAYADYYQYEGDTTWEDFGMLSSLAVHEGRCEDCSNVENAMLRTLGIPGCQAYTPWWGHQDGNHAWTWVRGIGEAPADGRNGVKVFVKTWDGNEDVTAEYSPVVRINVATPAEDNALMDLLVWNSEDWRDLVSVRVMDGQAEFPDVGCRLNQVLCFRCAGQPDQLCDLRSNGSYSWLRLDPQPDNGGFRVDYDKTTPVGEMDPGADYELLYYTTQGWLSAPSERLSTGGISFLGHSDRLYRISGPGVANRPFTVAMDGELGEILTLKR